MTNIAQVLRDARALIQTPDKWTRGTLARDASGEPVFEDSKNPLCFCVIGAICKVTNSNLAHARFFLRRFLPVGWESIAAFNDHPDTTHADVMALFDRAIAAAEAEAQS